MSSGVWAMSSKFMATRGCGRCDHWFDAETPTVYPDMKPAVGTDGKPLGPEMIPVPEGMPAQKPTSDRNQ